MPLFWVKAESSNNPLCFICPNTPNFFCCVFSVVLPERLSFDHFSPTIKLFDSCVKAALQSGGTPRRFGGTVQTPRSLNHFGGCKWDKTFRRVRLFSKTNTTSFLYFLPLDI